MSFYDDKIQDTYFLPSFFFSKLYTGNRYLKSKLSKLWACYERQKNKNKKNLTVNW